MMLYLEAGRLIRLTTSICPRREQMFGGAHGAHVGHVNRLPASDSLRLLTDSFCLSRARA
jgi:hypothetical protein